MSRSKRPTVSERRSARGLAALAVGLIAAAAAGCGGGGGESGSAKAELERLIRSQLPQQARQNFGTAVTVRNVICTQESDSTYRCIASVQGTDGRGGLETVDLPISGTCDDESCQWRTE